MKRKKTKKPKRFICQYKFPNHVIWQASHWSTNSEPVARRKAVDVPIHNYGEERIWDRKKRKEVKV
jgi:hypothetical protein